MPNVLVDSYTSTPYNDGNSLCDASSDKFLAYSFIASASYTLVQLDTILYINGGAPTGQVTAYIYADDGTGKPSSSPLGTSTNTIDASTAPAQDTSNPTYFTWNFSGVTISSGTKYHFALSNSIVSGTNFLGMADKTGNSLNFSNSSDGATWNLLASNLAGLFKSYKAGGPTIDTQPVNTIAYAGNTATFTVAATTSGGALSYQWKLNGSNVGTNSSSYTTATLALGDNASTVRCDVSDSNGTTSTQTVYIFVWPNSTVAWIKG